MVCGFPNVIHADPFDGAADCLPQDPHRTLHSPVTYDEPYMPCYPVPPQGNRTRMRGPIGQTFPTVRRWMYLDPQLHDPSPRGQG